MTLDVGAWLDTTFQSMDYAVFEFFSKIHAEWLTPIMRVLTEMGDDFFVIPMALIGVLLCFSKKTRKVGMTLFLAIIIGTLITNVAIKPLIARGRPFQTLAENLEFMGWYTEVGAIEASLNRSFPSGHTTAAFEIGTALFLTVKNNKIRWIFPVYSVLIASTRLYFMVHYISDVIGGVIVGLTAGILAYFIAAAIIKSIDKSNNQTIKKFAELDIFANLKKS